VYDQHPDIVATEIVARRPGFRRDEEPVLAVDVAHIDCVTPLARQARQLSAYPVGDLACFNVDLSREFRYCLETGTDPTPASELSTLRFSVPVTETSNNVYGELSVAGDTVTGSPSELLTAVQRALDTHDPDVLVCSTSEIIPTLYEMATDAGVEDFSLSRWPDVDYQQLASRSTYSSYGRVGHSPARYNVPGRAIIDESNTFFYGRRTSTAFSTSCRVQKSPSRNLRGRRSGTCSRRSRSVRPTTAASSSHGTLGVTSSTNRWGRSTTPTAAASSSPQRSASTRTSTNSTSPRCIRTSSVPGTSRRTSSGVAATATARMSPASDTRSVTTGATSSTCYSRSSTLATRSRRPSVARRNGTTPTRTVWRSSRGRLGALKWILVACFGYQGFSNAKFGRIECHEAINAFAREILLTAKQRLEAGGWRVVHGIVDSIWVTPGPDVDDEDREDLKMLATEITDCVEIRLEHEAHYDWVAFVPQRESEAGALTKYFGKVAGDDEFKIRGIEARQRSTPPFIEDVQRDCLERLNATRSPDAVLGCLERAMNFRRAT